MCEIQDGLINKVKSVVLNKYIMEHRKRKATNIDCQ